MEKIFRVWQELFFCVFFCINVNFIGKKKPKISDRWNLI